MFDTGHTIDTSGIQERIMRSVVADGKSSSRHKVLILMMATLLQSVSRLATLCIYHDFAHKLACHKGPYTLLLHVLTLRCLIDWLWHWRHFKHH